MQTPGLSIIDIERQVIPMANMVSAIQDTIPISLFNKGRAGKIFGEVKKHGAKVVMKNNVAECVLLSPEEYIKLMDEIQDARLLSLAAERLSHAEPSSFVSQEELMKKQGITKEDVDTADEVELE